MNTRGDQFALRSSTRISSFQEPSPLPQQKENVHKSSDAVDVCVCVSACSDDAHKGEIS